MYQHKKYLLFDLGNIFVVAALYLANNYFFKHLDCISEETRHFLICYFNDLICPFGFMSYLNILFRFAKYRIQRLWEIGLWCFCSGLIWEYFAPLVKPSAVADPYDILCYLLGGIGYYLLNYISFNFRTHK